MFEYMTCHEADLTPAVHVDMHNKWPLLVTVVNRWMYQVRHRSIAVEVMMAAVDWRCLRLPTLRLDGVFVPTRPSVSLIVRRWSCKRPRS